MNAVIDTIKKRHSIRFFEEKPVSREILETVIEAGNLAPTGSRQMWRFVVVTDPAFRKRLKEKAIPRYKQWMATHASPAFNAIRAEMDAVHPDPIYYNAPAIVFVIGKGPIAPADTPLVAENLILAAESMGLGTCYVYFGQLPLDDQEIRDAFEITEDEHVCGPIVVGYPSPDQPPPAPKSPPSVRWI